MYSKESVKRAFINRTTQFMNEEKVCPEGHVLNADGVCSRDGYAAPAEAVAEAAPEAEAPETITESEAAEAEAGAVSKEEAEAAGVDTEKAEAEATTVEVVPDAQGSESAPAVEGEAKSEEFSG